MPNAKSPLWTVALTDTGYFCDRRLYASLRGYRFAAARQTPSLQVLGHKFAYRWARVALRGDIIMDVNGKPVSDTNQLRMSISMMQPDSTVNLRVLRNGRTRGMAAKLGELQSTGEERAKARGRVPAALWTAAVKPCRRTLPYGRGSVSRHIVVGFLHSPVSSLLDGVSVEA